MAALAAVACGCVGTTARGVAPSGEALRVQARRQLTTHQGSVVVGQVELRGAGGQPGGSAVLTRPVQTVETRIVLDYYQGTTRLDEEDFFRIAGDARAYAELRDYRRSGARLGTAGAYLMLGGLAGLVAGLAAYDDGHAGRSQAVVAASLVVAGLGGPIFSLGKSALDTSPYFSVERAERAAAHYNAHSERRP